MTDESKGPAELPRVAATSRRRNRFNLVWLVPLVAVLIGGWLAVKTILEKGPTVTITFKSAEGIEAGKTKLKYKDVEIGQVSHVGLSPDLRQVIVTAELIKDFTPHLTEDAAFWVVRARVSGGRVSGLGTLLSGAYIGVDAGKKGQSRRQFAGLETPPVVQIDTPGREFVLRSEDLGSLDVGTPLFYRRLQVGQVTAFKLDEKGESISLKVFVNEPYDKFVTHNARFWQASGIDLSVDSSGVRLHTQSITSILTGGIAFEVPGEIEIGDAAAAGTEYALFGSRAEAMKNPESVVQRVAMRFDESVRGLDVGARVDLSGINVGEVVGLHTDIDPATDRVFIIADVDLYPERLRKRVRQEDLKRQTLTEVPERDRPWVMVGRMVDKGLRGRLQSANLLTGQLLISLETVPEAPKVQFDWTNRSKVRPWFPTAPSSMKAFQQSVANIVRKFEAMPLDQIGNDLRQTLRTTNTLLARLDSEIVDEARGTLGDARLALRSLDRLLANESPLQQDARLAMREFERAARSLRVLADYLERHPEALLRGKSEDQP